MRKLSLISILAVLAFFSVAVAQAATATGPTTMTVTVGAEATINITNGTTALAGAGGFANFTGTTNLTYQVRTSIGGSGNVTLKVTSDFNCLGGPCILTPPTAGDTLTYTCTASGGSGPTACTGAQTASTTASTSVLTLGADKHSTFPGSDSGAVSWTLVNDPKYKTGSYSSTVTFTISAT
jgi:hypothetical protein